MKLVKNTANQAVSQSYQNFSKKMAQVRRSQKAAQQDEYQLDLNVNSDDNNNKSIRFNESRQVHMSHD